MNLERKVALVVGARRMGLALATALAAKGADVALTYRQSREAAEVAADAVRTRGRRAFVISCDVTDDESVVEAVNRATAELGRLDVLVMMASRYEEIPFDQLDAGAMERTLDVDMRGTFLCMRAAIPHLRRAGGGRIINVSDWTAASGRPRYKGYTPYYVAKAGVKALTEAFALELAADKILVNALAPGPVLAPEAFSEAERSAVERATPLGQWGGAEVVAQAVIGLIESDFITGETLRLDGGRHLR